MSTPQDPNGNFWRWKMRLEKDQNLWQEMRGTPRQIDSVRNAYPGAANEQRLIHQCRGLIKTRLSYLQRISDGYAIVLRTLNADSATVLMNEFLSPMQTLADFEYQNFSGCNPFSSAQIGDESTFVSAHPLLERQSHFTLADKARKPQYRHQIYGDEAPPATVANNEPQMTQQEVYERLIFGVHVQGGKVTVPGIDVNEAIPEPRPIGQGLCEVHFMVWLGEVEPGLFREYRMEANVAMKAIAEYGKILKGGELDVHINIQVGKRPELAEFWRTLQTSIGPHNDLLLYSLFESKDNLISLFEADNVGFAGDWMTAKPIDNHSLGLNMLGLVRFNVFIEHPQQAVPQDRGQPMMQNMQHYNNTQYFVPPTQYRQPMEEYQQQHPTQVLAFANPQQVYLTPPPPPPPQVQQQFIQVPFQNYQDNTRIVVPAQNGHMYQNPQMYQNEPGYVRNGGYQENMSILHIETNSASGSGHSTMMGRQQSLPPSMPTYPVRNDYGNYDNQRGPVTSVHYQQRNNWQAQPGNYPPNEASTEYRRNSNPNTRATGSVEEEQKNRHTYVHQYRHNSSFQNRGRRNGPASAEYTHNGYQQNRGRHQYSTNSQRYNDQQNVNPRNVASTSATNTVAEQPPSQPTKLVERAGNDEVHELEVVAETVCNVPVQPITIETSKEVTELTQLTPKLATKVSIDSSQGDSGIPSSSNSVCGLNGKTSPIDGSPLTSESPVESRNDESLNAVCGSLLKVALTNSIAECAETASTEMIDAAPIIKQTSSVKNSLQTTNGVGSSSVKTTAAESKESDANPPTTNDMQDQESVVETEECENSTSQITLAISSDEPAVRKEEALQPIVAPRVEVSAPSLEDNATAGPSSKSSTSSSTHRSRSDSTDSSASSGEDETAKNSEDSDLSPEPEYDEEAEKKKEERRQRDKAKRQARKHENKEKKKEVKRLVKEKKEQRTKEVATPVNQEPPVKFGNRFMKASIGEAHNRLMWFLREQKLETSGFEPARRNEIIKIMSGFSVSNLALLQGSHGLLFSHYHHVKGFKKQALMERKILYYVIASLNPDPNTDRSDEGKCKKIMAEFLKSFQEREGRPITDLESITLEYAYIHDRALKLKEEEVSLKAIFTTILRFYQHHLESVYKTFEAMMDLYDFSEYKLPPVNIEQMATKYFK